MPRQSSTLDNSSSERSRLLSHQQQQEQQPAPNNAAEKLLEERRRQEEMAEAQRRKQQVAEELRAGKDRTRACSLECVCATLFIKPLSAIIEYVAAFSFVGIFVTYSAVTCFVFAMVLLIMQLPTGMDVAPIYGNETAATTTTSASAAPREVENGRVIVRQETVMQGDPGFYAAHAQYLKRQQPKQQTNRRPSNAEAWLSGGGEPATTSLQLGNITGYVTTYHTPINFLNATFLTIGAYSGGGLGSVNYSIWSTAGFVVLALTMTFGDMVLLTMIPAVIRYRALCKERDKLIVILEATGAYDIDQDDEEGEDPKQQQSGVLAVISDVGPHEPEYYSSSASSMDTRVADALPSAKAATRSDLQSGMLQREASSESKLEAAGQSPRRNAATGTGARIRATTILYGPIDSPSSTPRLQQLQQSRNEEEALNEQERKRFEEQEALRKIAARLTFGKRLIYEDGLASVQQQIDISLIIIANVVFYFTATHLLFTLMCVAGGKSAWWGLFHVISAFNNVGYTFSVENMIPINHDAWLMFTLTLCIPAGNTLFPVFFRLQMSLLHRLIRRITRMCDGKYAQKIVFGQPLIVWQHSVRLLLRYPRKYYTHIFPKHNTLVLFLLWLLATAIGFFQFMPQLDNTQLFPVDTTGWMRFWIALFQTVSVRAAGFSIMNLDAVPSGLLAWWILAMYTSAYPLIVTVRASANKDMDADNSAEELRHEASSVVGTDLFWLYLAVILISYGEQATLDTHLFLRICFEVSSAFGGCGLSLSLPSMPDVAYSGSMGSFSLCVMIVVMFCGKHRGLPRSVDEAIAIQVREYEFTQKELDPDAESLIAGTAASTIGDGSNNTLRPSVRESLRRNANWMNSNSADDEVKRKQQEEREKDDLLLIASDGTVNASADAVLQETTTRSSVGGAGGSSMNKKAAVAALLNSTHPQQQRNNHSFAGAYWVDDDGEIARLNPDQIFRRRVQAFYEHYNPLRLKDLDKIIGAFAQNPSALLRNLALTYGAEPAHKRAMSSAAAAEILQARVVERGNAGAVGGAPRGSVASSRATRKSETSVKE